jgi:hypothetical protein
LGSGAEILVKVGALSATEEFILEGGSALGPFVEFCYPTKISCNSVDRCLTSPSPHNPSEGQPEWKARLVNKHRLDLAGIETYPADGKST